MFIKKRVSGGYDLLKNLLTLSNNLKYLKVTHNMVAPGIIEESMFLSNKQLETIKIEMFIQEIKV